MTRALVLVLLVLPACGDKAAAPNPHALSDGGGAGMSATGCTKQADCDDGLACTDDTCLVGGACRNEPHHERCAAEQQCLSGVGCVARTGCKSNAECEDRVACTDDLCDIDGTCRHLANSRLCAPGQTCSPAVGCTTRLGCSTDAECDDHRHCNGLEVCNTELACVAGMPPNCDDGEACTDDGCDDGARACTHTRRPECSGSSVSGTFDLAPRVTFMCEALGTPLINLDAAAVVLAESGGMLTVTGLGPNLTGPASSMMMFQVTGVVTGTCNETYTLAGRFTDANHFSATFTATLSGFGCDLATCTPPAPATFMVTGTRR